MTGKKKWVDESKRKQMSDSAMKQAQKRDEKRRLASKGFAKLPDKKKRKT